jgi:hypothetical protein
MADLMPDDSLSWAVHSVRPQISKESRNLARFSAAETGTVFGTVSIVDLEP